MDREEQQNAPPERMPLIDRVGPKTFVAVAASLITAAAIGAVALRDLVVVATVHVAGLKERADDFEQRLRTQEQRPPRLSPGLDEVRAECEKLGELIGGCKERASVIERDIQHIQREQTRERLCERVQSCKGQR